MRRDNCRVVRGLENVTLRDAGLQDEECRRASRSVFVHLVRAATVDTVVMIVIATTTIRGCTIFILDCGGITFLIAPRRVN